MKKMINWLENSFSPKMNKINHNVWIVALKDSVMQILPFIFLGSIFCMLAILNDYFPNLPNFWTPYGWTMGMVSLLVAFLLPLNLLEKKRLRKQRLIGAMTGLVSFLMIISPQVIKDGTVGFTHDALGAGGMFVAIIAGLFVSWVMVLFGKFSFFKEESVIPDFVRSWFDSMLPVGLVIVLVWVVVDIANVDIYNIILAIFSPLGSILETPYGFALSMFLVCFLYSMGISSWVLTPVFQPLFLTAITQNVAGNAENLVTNTTIFSTYLWVGGVGCTLPLVVMMLLSKSSRLKALARASIAPTIFNINEPIVFGAIVWNPLLMLPMWLIGLVAPLVTWIFTKVIPFAPIPMLQFEMWYCPFPFATWLSTGSITAIALMLIVTIICALIWYPFFKAYEKQEVDKEQGLVEE